MSGFNLIRKGRSSGVEESRGCLLASFATLESRKQKKNTEYRILTPEFRFADFQPSFRATGGTASWLERGCFARRTKKLSVASVSGEQLVCRLVRAGGCARGKRRTRWIEASLVSRSIFSHGGHGGHGGNLGGRWNSCQSGWCLILFVRLQRHARRQA